MAKFKVGDKIQYDADKSWTYKIKNILIQGSTEYYQYEILTSSTGTQIGNVYSDPSSSIDVAFSLVQPTAPTTASSSPKFKVGDIILNNQGAIREITVVANGIYTYKVIASTNSAYIGATHIDTIDWVDANFSLAAYQGTINTKVTKPTDQYVGKQFKVTVGFVTRNHYYAQGIILQVKAKQTTFPGDLEVFIVGKEKDISTIPPSWIKDFTVPYEKTECTCSSRDLLNKGCKCGYTKPFKSKWEC